jgi:hypothetical protein
MQPSFSSDKKYIFPNPPVVIGGLGGSGTRLIAAILQHLEFDMGSDLNKTNDNLAFTLLFKRPELWPIQEHALEIHQALALFFKAGFYRKSLNTRDVELVNEIAQANSLQHPSDWLQKRQQDLKEPGKNCQQPAQWGWKEPNTHIFLPALEESVQQVKYIHVMRNGLDMANSTNQSQVKLWGELLTGEKTTDPGPDNSFRYWCAVHRRVLEASRDMGDRFLLLNFDDFCLRPKNGVESLLNFLGMTAPGTMFSELIQMVNPPPTIGRYKTKPIISASASDIELLNQLGFEYY